MTTIRRNCGAFHWGVATSGRKLRHAFNRTNEQRLPPRVDRLNDSKTWSSLSRNGQAAVDRLERQRKGLNEPVSRIARCRIGLNRYKPGRVIDAPSVMSLEENRDDFLGFLYYYRNWVHVQPRFQNSTGLTSVDLANVKILSLDAALVLTAEYHRNCRTTNYKPWVDDESWPPEVVELLDELGFYTFVDAKGHAAHHEKRESTRRFVRFVSGSKVLGEKADELIDALRNVGGKAPAREPIYAALVEAILNVTNHAYKERPAEVFATTEDWWAAGSYDPADQTLEFVVYDQGVGIPTRLPRNPTLFELIRLFVRGTDDADIIGGAIEFGQTSTDLPERGNGLWMICKLAEELDGSSVRILSGRGEVTYISQEPLRKVEHANPFCGTLIKWSLKLPAEPDLVSGRSS